MKTTLINLFTSKKFLAALAAVVIYVGGRFGFDVDPAALDRIFAALLVYVGAQGVADVGKGAAQVKAAADLVPQPPASGSNIIGTFTSAALALLVIGLVGSTQLSCAPAEAVVAAAPGAARDAVVDCVKADQAPIVRLLVQLGADALTYVLHGGVVDWDALEVAAWAEGKTTGGCALAEFVAGVTSKQPAARTLMGAPNPALVALERLRQQAGGVQWRTPGGML